MHLRRCGVVLAVLFLTHPLRVFGQQSGPSGAKRPITEKDLFRFTWIANPELSPDGSRVAFTRVIVDEKRFGYETSIWTVATSGQEFPLRMTNGKHDTTARWSPDGGRIAFVRGGEKDEAGKPRPPQIAVLSLAGGEALTITDLPKGVSHPVWSPDSRRIVFLSTTTAEDIEKEERKKNAAKPDEDKESESTKNRARPKQPEPESEHESDVHVITRAIYRSNEEGYLDPKRRDHIWVLDVPNTSDELAKPKDLSRNK
jgi:dipeptidyl aminopeptidase/acylaminoacyl peptidase